MLKLKTKWFHNWTEKNRISDDILLKTIENVSNNLGSTKLGNGLFKVRLAKEGKGKRGGFRTILVYKENEIVIFIYGFAKNEKDNIEKDEIKYFRKLANDLLGIKINKFRELEKNGNFVRIKDNKL